MNIAIVDYGIGNVKSIVNAFKKIGIEPTLTNNKETLLKADGVVLPGVGAFAHGMQSLNELSLVKVIYEYVESGKPFLGICLGMQMLLEESEEFGVTKGLGLIRGKVVKLSVKEETKLPHIGWNEIDKKDINWYGTILDGIEDSEDMYFVHSYVASPSENKNILSVSEYSGFEFCSSLKKDNIYGCQYHPEKSASSGVLVLENFVKICKDNR